MIRTQIQIPEPLYKDLKRVAKQLDWSLAEVLRRGGELLVARYPARQNEAEWRLPAPLDLGGPPLISLEGFNAEVEAIEYKTLNDLR